MVRPTPRGRDPTSAGARRPSLSLRHGVLLHPLTRACVRLLGPCFKTGRVGCRHRRRPLTPFTWAGPRPGDATRLGRTEDSPPRSTVAPGAGGPVPPNEWERGRSEHLVHGPGKRRGPGEGRCKARGRSREPPSPRAFPSRPRAGRGAPPAEEMRPARASQRRGEVPRGDPPTPNGRP